jgi:acyl-CoA thioesterase-1
LFFRCLLAAAACGTGADAPRNATAAVAESSGAHPAVPTATPTPLLGIRRRVLIIGTSLTAGLGLNPEDSYPSVLQRMADSASFNVDIVNAGLSGETSAGALRRVDWLLSQPADVVIVETGANDGLRALDPDTTAANLRSIISEVKVRSPGAAIVLAQMEAPTNLGRDYTRRFHDIFPTVARETGVTLMPFLLDGVAAHPALNQNDGIHPTEAGARLVAANVWRTLRTVLERIEDEKTRKR